MRGWARQGVLVRAFEAMQALEIVRIKVEVCVLPHTHLGNSPVARPYL